MLRAALCITANSGCQCTLWVKSRHRGTSDQCPLYPQKRTSELSRRMSALCQKRTFVLFDHLVGNGEHTRRNCKIECLGRFQIDHQLELGWLYDRKVGWLCSCNNPAGIHANLAIYVGQISNVADQSTS